MDANVVKSLDKFSRVDMKKFSRQLREMLLINSSLRLPPLDEEFFVHLLILFELLDAMEDAPKEPKMDLLAANKTKQK